jgi:SAM-dependent methyltransferase
VTTPTAARRPWWREFFESEDSVPLSFFPCAEETAQEVEGLRRLLDLRPGQLVADICCGMGRHARPLAEAGLEVVGLDASAMMLAAAKRSQGEKQRLMLVRADAQALPLRCDSMDVALNLFNSFGYLEDDAANQRVLEETARCLRPGGKFLLETRNRQHQILYAPYHLEVALADGSPAIVQCRYDGDTHQLHSTWTRATAAQPQGSADEVIYRASIRLFGLDELAEMFRGAGLAVDAIYGDYQGTPFGGHERMLILVAHKAAAASI